MKRKRIVFIFCTLVIGSLVVALTFKCFSKKEPSNREEFSRELLQKISFEERKSLSDLCKSIFYTSEFGYTLFGDKPISEICDSGRIYENEELSFFQKHLFIFAQRYEKKLDALHFAIVVDSSEAGSFIYLVNKRAFRDKVHQNIKIFRDILGDSITPNSLLESVLDKNCGFEKALKGSHSLFGILFGYGVENSLRFDRRDQLEPSWLRQGFPPWKGIQTQDEINGLDVMTFGCLRMHAIKGLVVKTAPEKIMPSPGFLTVQDELDYLNKKLALAIGTNDPLCVLLTIGIPQFAGDPESEETRKLVEKYTTQRTVLMKMLAEDNFINKVLEKFYSTDCD
jgi:hypothetical protein